MGQGHKAQGKGGESIKGEIQVFEKGERGQGAGKSCEKARERAAMSVT